jgi:hypothetical protein
MRNGWQSKPETWHFTRKFPREACHVAYFLAGMNLASEPAQLKTLYIKRLASYSSLPEIYDGLQAVCDYG